MNTKGMKFLAVLAVFAMAFAAFAVVAPAETDDANASATTQYDLDTDNITKYVAGTTTIEDTKAYYIDADATIDVPEDARTVLFVLKGVTLTMVSSTDANTYGYAFAAFVNVKSIDSNNVITFDSVSLDKAAWQNSAANTAVTTMVGAPTWGHECHSWEKGETFTMTANSNGTGFTLGTTTSTTTVDVYRALNLSGTFGTVDYKEDVAVHYKDFTGTIKIGTSEAYLSGFTGSITATTGTSAASIANWTAGNIEIKSQKTLKLGAALEIPASSALIIDAATATLTRGTLDGVSSANTITNNGVLINDGAITGTGHGSNTVITNNTTGKITLNGSITATAHSDAYYFTTLNDGTITTKAGMDVNSAAEIVIAPASTGKIVNNTNADFGIWGTLGTETTTFYAYQKVIVEDDLVINTGITVQGVLYIPEGKTVTITGTYGKLTVSGYRAAVQNYGTIVIENEVNNGTFIIDDATLDNYGVIEVRSTAATEETLVIGDGTHYAVFNNSGSFVDETGKVWFQAKSTINNKSTGSMEIYSSVDFDAVQEFTNAGSIIAAGLFDMGGAYTIKMVSNGATFTATNMSVDNSTLTIENTTALPSATNYNNNIVKATFGDSDPNFYQGLTIKSGWYKIAGDNKTSRSLDLSGTLNVVTGDGTAVYDIDLTVKGVITVLDGLNIPGLADLKFHADGASLYVKGAIIVNQIATNGGRIVAAGGNDIISVVSGYIASPQINIGTSGGTDKLLASYYYKNNGLGIMYYYMPLKDAIAGAVENEVSRVYIGNTNAEMSISSDIEIPAGINVTNNATLTVDKDCTVTVKDGATLTNSNTITVKGTVYAENARTGIKGTEPVADVKQSGEVDVRYTNLANALANSSAGDVIVITADAGVTIADDMTIPEGRTVDTNDKNFTVNADKTLTVNGTLFINGGVYTNNGEVVVNGYLITDKVTSYAAGWPAGAYYKFTVNNLDYNGICGIDKMDDVIDDEISYAFTVYGVAKAPAITVSATSDNKATVAFTDDVEISTLSIEFATVTFAVGTTVKATVTDGISSASIYAIVGDTVLSIADTADAFTVAGKTVKGTLGTKYSFAIDGLVTLGDATIPNATINGTVSTAKTVTLDDAKVAGALVADYKGTINATNMTVTGTLTTMDIDTSKTAGAVTITGQLIVGKISIYKKTGEGAEVSGNVTLGSSACAIVVNGSSIDEEIVDGLKVTTITVDKKPWLTIYGNGKADLSKFVIPVTDAKATYIGTTALPTDGNYLPDGYEVTIGDKATIDITVDYSIYKVTIYTDAGIKAVSIDGIEMFNQQTNKFVTLDGSELKAGTHKVAYTLKSGYEGSAILYTQDGTILKDLSFSVSGDVTSLVLQLNGTEQIVIPEPSPVEQNEWTITTILLVILVILIAIMAVIVALRLNRS